MGNRDIKDAEPILQKVWAYVESDFTKAHPECPKPILSEVYRNPDLQRAYYAQGREPVARVNSQRRLAGLGPISEVENRKKVTNSKPGQSNHNFYPSKAIDMLFIEPGTKKISENRDWYLKLAKFVRAKFPEITWGADWNRNWKTEDERFLDQPHFETKRTA